MSIARLAPGPDQWAAQFYYVRLTTPNLFAIGKLRMSAGRKATRAYRAYRKNIRAGFSPPADDMIASLSRLYSFSG